MKQQRISFYDQIQANKNKSMLLIAGMIIVFIILGYLISLALDPSYFFIIMIISIIFSMGYTIFSYYNSHKIAIASVRAKPASKTEHRALFHATESMALASGLPMPKLYVMESDAINAFASGRDPKNAVMCFTTGALRKLNKQELEGVVAHEMSHIANYDIRFMTLTAVMVGMIAIIAEIFLRSLFWSSITGGRSNDNRDGRLQIILIVVGVLFAILAPLVANLVSLAISRKREYAADATGVKFTRYPAGLASALKKIKGEHLSPNEKRRYSKAVAPLFISDPFKKKVKGLFSTHPPVEERIKRLERM